MIRLGGLSMSTIAVLGGAVSLVLVVLYLLKLRRRMVLVPFLPLWEEIVPKKRHQSLLEKLRRLLSLLLQLLFLWLLVLALSDPRLGVELLGGRSIVLMVDISASMRAKDIGLNAVKGKVRERRSSSSPVPDAGTERTKSLGGAIKPKTARDRMKPAGGAKNGRTSADAGPPRGQPVLKKVAEPVTDAAKVGMTKLPSVAKEPGGAARTGPLRRRAARSAKLETRLARARREALRIVDSLVGSDRVMLVAIGHDPVPLTGFTSNQALLRKRIRELSAVDTVANLPLALAIARDALAGRTGGKVVVISDGAVSNLAATPKKAVKRGASGGAKGGAAKKGGRAKKGRARKAPGRKRPNVVKPGDAAAGQQLKAVEDALAGLPSFHLVRVGGPTGNIGIVAFDARRVPERPARFKAFIEVRNFSFAPCKGAIELLSNGLVDNNYPFVLRPGESLRRVLTGVTRRRRVEARLRVLGCEDALASDNRAFAALPVARRLAVLVAGKRSLFLDAALLSDSRLHWRRVSCAAAAKDRGARDLVILNECGLPSRPKSGGYLLVNPPEENGIFAMATGRSAKVRTPVISWVNRSHPVTRFLSLRDLNIGEARVIKQESGVVPLVRSLRGALLMAAAERGRMRAVALSVSLRSTDLPLRVAFPVLVQNIVRWLGQREGAGAGWAQRTGHVARVALPSGVSEYSLKGPGFKGEVKFKATRGIARFVPLRAGFFQIGHKAGKELVAVNMTSILESDLERRPVVAGRKVSVTAQASRSLPLRTNIWLYMLILAAFLTLVEWLTYNRRTTV